MTDKEIIIDDVQIRGCGHYWNGTCHAYVDNTGKFLLCIKSPNCYYKQLKRQQYYLEKIRAYELNSLDVDWDEYEQHACDCEYSPIIDFVELALGEKEDV